MPTGDFKFACETCRDTGYYGDNGPGIKGNGEYHRCDQCKVEPPAPDELDTLRRQLAAANERAGRLEADNVSLRAGILGHSEYGDYQRARDAWRVRRVGAGSAVQVSSACDTLDAYFGVEVHDAL